MGTENKLRLKIDYVRSELAKGVKQKAIAERLGVTPRTIWNWLKKADAMPSLEAQREEPNE